MLENYGRLLWLWTVAVRLLHAPPPLAARGFTRHRKNRTGSRKSGSASSPLPFPAGGGSFSHLQNIKSQPVDFIFIFLFFLCLLSSSRFVSLCWWQIRPLVHGPDLLRGVEPMKKSRGLPGLHELAAGSGEWAVEAEWGESWVSWLVGCWEFEILPAFSELAAGSGGKWGRPRLRKRAGAVLWVCGGLDCDGREKGLWFLCQGKGSGCLRENRLRKGEVLCAEEKGLSVQ